MQVVLRGVCPCITSTGACFECALIEIVDGFILGPESYLSSVMDTALRSSRDLDIHDRLGSFDAECHYVSYPLGPIRRHINNQSAHRRRRSTDLLPVCS